MFEYTKTYPPHLPSARSRSRAYLSLIKPGIVSGNIVAVAAGFFLACNACTSVPYPLLFWLIIGAFCIITSACMINNCIDWRIDQLMLRTQKRALPSGEVAISTALICGCFLFSAGMLVLCWKVNLLSAVLGMVGFFIYVLVYSIFLKKHSEYAILIGSLSGAIPPVMGYSALSQDIDIVMVLLFITFASWQIPHSYAIAIFRQKDYERAYIPVYPAKRGFQATKQQSLFFMMLFWVSSNLLFWYSYASWFILGMNTAVCAYWFCQALFYQAKNHEEWGRRLFIVSIQVVTGLSLLMMVSGWAI